MTSAKWFSKTFELPGQFKESQNGGTWMAQWGDS